MRDLHWQMKGLKELVIIGTDSVVVSSGRRLNKMVLLCLCLGVSGNESLNECTISRSEGR